MNAQQHLILGILALAIGILFALVGQQVLAPEHVHPIGTGLIAIGVVATAVSLIERKGERSRRDHAR
ncbi:MAG TPA: hypothetical protein PK095_05700 [Myxococcota bacterium]|nr:hypothetical protein [Myxococcota bacterium]